MRNEMKFLVRPAFITRRTMVVAITVFTMVIALTAPCSSIFAEDASSKESHTKIYKGTYHETGEKRHHRTSDIRHHRTSRKHHRSERHLKDGKISFFNAIRKNDLVIASRLLNQGQNPDIKDATGYTPLMIAAGLGNYQMCDLLLSADADPHIVDNRMGASALHKAAQGGVVSVARLLLKHGAFIDLQAPTHGHTPLHDASWHRNKSMVEFLLSAGANWEILASNGTLAKNWSQWAKDDHIVAAFEKYEKIKADYVKADRIFSAIEKDDVKTVKALIAGGIDVDQKAKYKISPKSPKDITPLLLATREGRTEIVSLLLKAGASTRIVDWLMKSTVVHKSGYKGHAKNIPLIMDHDAEIDAQGPYNGYTALHDAVWHGHYDCAKALVNAGARLNLKGHDGNTPLDLARKNGYTKIEKMLIKALHE